MPGDIGDTNKFVSQVCQNTKSDLIEITEDKLENILIKYTKSIKKTNSWITPFSLLSSILISISTSDVNKDLLNIKKEVWTAMYYLAGIGCFVWTLINIIQAISNREKSKIVTVIKKIKNN